MKIISIIFFVFLSNTLVKADIIKARVQATGLTCSLCSKATFKQLSTIADIEKIDVDLNNTSFILLFKKGTNVNPNIIKQKIEAAGFSVGFLELTVNCEIINNQFSLGNNLFTITNSYNKTSSKTMNVKVLNKGFLTNKEYKNIAKQNVQIAKKVNSSNSFFVEVI